MSYQLTKKEKLKEIVKSGKEPKYFINSYTKISHPIKGLIPFKTYDFQDTLLDDFNNGGLCCLDDAFSQGQKHPCHGY